MPSRLDISDFSIVVWCSSCPTFSRSTESVADALSIGKAHNRAMDHAAGVNLPRGRSGICIQPQCTRPARGLCEEHALPDNERGPLSPAALNVRAVIAESVRLGRMCECGKPVRNIKRMLCSPCSVRRSKENKSEKATR